MVEFSERFDLSQLDAFIPASVFLLHFFDGDYLASFDIGGLVDCPEGTISQCFYRLVFLHD